MAICCPYDLEHLENPEHVCRQHNLGCALLHQFLSDARSIRCRDSVLGSHSCQHYSVNVPLGYYTNNGAVHVTDANFCNVTISYTHPGQNDTIHVQVWLPEDSWNRRMQGIGCGGWAAGSFYLSFMGMTSAGRRICSTVNRCRAGLSGPEDLGTTQPWERQYVSPSGTGISLAQ